MTSKAITRGKGIFNKIISNLPVELHITGCQYCGPGTKLAKRLAHGDPGINPLDQDCKEHDIAYSQNRNNLEEWHEAERIFVNKAWSRVQARNSGIGEKAAAWTITNAMKLKTKFGLGLKKKPSMKRKKNRDLLLLTKLVTAAKQSIVPGNNTKLAIKSVFKGARIPVKEAGGRRNVKKPHILSATKKISGLLPFLLPHFAGLSVVGAFSGSVVGVGKANTDTRVAKKNLKRLKDTKKQWKLIALGKGVYHKPYKKDLPRT